MKSVSPSVRRARTARRLALWLSLSLLVASLSFITHGQLQTDAEAAKELAIKQANAGHKHTEFVPGRVLVRFRTDTAAKAAESRVASLRLADGEVAATQVARFEGSNMIPGLRVVNVAPEQTLQTVAALNARSDVLYAEPDYVRRIEKLPNDTELARMWALKNTGQTITTQSWNTDICGGPAPCTVIGGNAGADINAAQAWDITTGSRNIVVGIVDTGIDINHPDLAANIWTNPGETAGDGVDNDGDGFVDDVHGWDFTAETNGTPCGPGAGESARPGCGNNVVFDGPGTYPTSEVDAHGTHVAGTIGAVGNNGTGTVGINWQVSILPLKFIDSSGSGDSINAIRAEAYAKALRDKYVATNGAQGANVRVLNNSYGGGGFSQAELDSIRALNGSGILFVVAAGNDSSNNDLSPTFPANYDAPNIISVAAIDRFDRLSSFSNFGGHTVHVAAPGSFILSTTPNNTYDFFYGTSMATPHVTGLAALALAANPNLTVKQLRDIILYNGDVTIGANGNQNTDITAANTYSRRRINAFKTVSAAIENDTTPPAVPGNLSVIGHTPRGVQLSWIEPGDDGMIGQAALYEFDYIDPGTNNTIFLGTQLPQSAGATGNAFVNLPYRHVAGLIRLKAIDNVGNESSALLAVDGGNDPYVPTESTADALTTGGTDVGLHADDGLQSYNLPWPFPFYGTPYSTITLSSNGIIYLANPPTGNDADSSAAALNYLTAIAGMWDDLRTDNAGGGIFVTQPDGNHIVFRWEGKTYNGTSAEAGFPFKFEIELSRDGTVRTRYGSGTGLNTNVNPVVGISGGAPEAYVSTSHTQDNSQGPPINLTNAGTVTFAPRNSLTPTVQFAANSVSVNEGAGSVTINVTRTNNLSAAASVNYETLDDPAAVRCDDQINNHGKAYARCDYATTNDTLNFAAGEAQKSFTVPIIDDGMFEGNETFQIALSNPSAGMALGTPAIITVTIIDNDTATTPNPILQGDANGITFFVRQQYLDFLSREPEAGEPWSAILRTCANQFNTDPNNAAAGCDRLIVSQSFFGSPEFQLKGYFVYRFYKLAFNRLPDYSEIIPDMRSVTGATSADVFAKKAAFANSFIARTEFVSDYNGLSNAGYVAALMARYSLTQITTPDPANPDGTTKVILTSADLTNRLNANTLTRAQVLRAVADSDQVFQLEFNQAFVAMQYYGYLRRTPEPGGYQAWLNYLNTHPSDSRTMVNGFMNSAEYRLRFGQTQ
jgi:subtilisin family serine protease